MRDWRLTFDEAPHLEVGRSLERLLLSGRIQSIAATAEDLAKAAVPSVASPGFRALARQHRELLLPEVEVRIWLHEGSEPDDEIGGWRLRTEPAEIDVRICACANPDWVVDATTAPWSDDEPAVHSSFPHFLVRAVLGDRL